ncbi:MAG: helix-turn-helix domain-containing protein [Armatimonadetes bacterium]|nr:helix-turn-helix domain-containing protein [Armatimonadota bacterium]
MATGQDRDNDGWAHAKLVYTLEECEGLLSISRSQLYRLIEQGDIETVQIGRSRRITHVQLDDFVARLHQSGEMDVVR